MKCQKCGANNANTHVKTIINGEFKEYDLCSECAHKLGYTNVFADMDNDFSSLLGSFFTNVLPASSLRCISALPSCFSSISKMTCATKSLILILLPSFFTLSGFDNSITKRSGKVKVK